MSINHSSEYSELTNKQFELIGKLMIEFSNLDFQLGMLLTRLLITPDFIGRTYTDQMMVTKRINAVENAIDVHLHRYDCRIIPKKILTEALEIVREIKGIKNLRNKFAHNCWSRWSDDKIFGTKISGDLPNPKKPNKNSITLTNSELIKYYEKSYSLVEKLEKIIYEIPEFKENIELIKKR